MAWRRTAGRSACALVIGMLAAGGAAYSQEATTRPPSDDPDAHLVDSDDPDAHVEDSVPLGAVPKATSGEPDPPQAPATAPSSPAVAAATQRLAAAQVRLRLADTAYADMIRDDHPTGSARQAIIDEREAARAAFRQAEQALASARAASPPAAGTDD